MNGQIEIRLSEVRRIPLRLGDELKTVYLDPLGNRCSCRIRVETEIGKGASCICYRVQAQFQQGIWHPYIMKEFYPDPVENRLEIIRNTDTRELQMDGDSQRLQLLRERFFYSSYALQNELSSLDALTDVVVAPTLRTQSAADNPLPAYILYEMNPGAEIGSEFLKNADAESLLQFAVKLTDSIQKLHEAQYLYMDIKPSNLLWTDHRDPGNARVMLFDFDSAVNLRNLRQLHAEELRITPNLSAPELSEQGSFEQDKRFLIRPCLDVYSIGSTLFWMLLGRFPGKDDVPAVPEQVCTWEAQLHTLCSTGALREQVPAKAQDALCWILKSCLCRRVRKRCGSAATLNRWLKTILAAVRLNVNRPAALEDVNYEIPVAHLFYEHPLLPYVKDGVLSVGLWGTSGIREEILKKLLSCCQMLDVTLKITVYDEKPEEYAQALCCLWPELENCAKLTVNGSLRAGTCRRFEIPLAELQIVPNQPDLLPEMKDFSVLFLTNVSGDINFRTAQTLSERAAEDRACMIAYADTRGDGFGLRNIDSAQKKPDMVPFGMNSYYSNGELSLNSELLQLSFGVHRFYNGNPTDPETVRSLWTAFQADRYGIRSSNRFVLSMPYKLNGFISCLPREQAQRFQEILETPEGMARLLWLEHRSWTAFVITEGYSCPDWNTVEHYAYTGKNNQRNAAKKLHPCICDSRITDLELQKLPPEEWLTADLSVYDPLDQVSLQLHRLCRRRAEKAKQLLPHCLELLEAELRSELGWAEAELWLHRLTDSAAPVLEGSAAAAWKSALEQTREMWNSQIRLNETVPQLLDLIEALMKPAVDFCRKIDYKKYDLDVLQFIPELLLKKAGNPQ